MKDNVCDKQGRFAEGCMMFRGVQLFAIFGCERLLIEMIIGNAYGVTATLVK